MATDAHSLPTQIARAFLTPLRCPDSSSEPVPPGTKAFSVEGPSGSVAVIRAGEGPPVLLVHGWEG